MAVFFGRFSYRDSVKFTSSVGEIKAPAISRDNESKWKDFSRNFNCWAIYIRFYMRLSVSEWILKCSKWSAKWESQSEAYRGRYHEKAGVELRHLRTYRLDKKKYSFPLQISNRFFHSYRSNDLLSSTNSFRLDIVPRVKSSPMPFSLVALSGVMSTF